MNDRAGYRYGYFQAGTGRARGQRMTIAERLRLRRRRKVRDDLAGVKGWWKP